MQQEKDGLPGRELHPSYRRTYGAKEYLREHGNGSNVFRTNRFSQPRALKPGDILATGDMVLSEPRTGFNSSVSVNLTSGLAGAWIELPPRIPVALLIETDEEYENLRQKALKHAEEIRAHLEGKQ